MLEQAERGGDDATFPARSAESWRTQEAVLCAIAAAAAFAFLTWRASRFFPTTQNLLGHDYEWFLPTLVVGHYWNQQNGWLALPYFSPAMCGGVPFLANPQSVFFSLPQLLLLLMEPTAALWATLLISAGVGAAGCFWLLRRYFETSVHAATLGGTLFLLNGFLFYRMIVGHLTYHAIAVVPLLACVVASSQRLAWSHWRQSSRLLVLPVVLGGLPIAYLSYGGALNFQIPAVLTVTCTLLMLQVARGFRVAPWLVLAGSCVWGIFLSAIKMVPAAILVSQFPRETIRYYVFHSPLDLLKLLEGFFLPAALTDEIFFQSGWGLHRHEFEFGVSMVPLVLMGLAMRRRLFRETRFEPRILRLALAALLLLPIAVTFGPRLWGSVLVRLPVINNNTVLVRWWAVYLLPIVIAAGRSFDGTVRASWRAALLVSCITVAIAQEASYNAQYYTTQAKYDPAPVTAAYRETTGDALPPIERILRPAGAQVGQGGWLPNDAFVKGASGWPCYEPLFGYHLELLPDFGLVDGPITLVSPDEHLNIVDPAAYFGGRDRAPASWRFAASRLAEAQRFADYRPYVWQEPWWHKAAATTTIATLLLTIGCLVLRGAAAVASSRRSRTAGVR